MSRARCLLAFGALVVAASLTWTGPGVGWAGSTALAPPRIRAHPTLAYYYIWFDPGSWDRAKTDEPLAGAYSSDDGRVMEDHVEAAQAAGMDGFIASWRNTPKLDRRLEQLADIAERHAFKLVVIYQGLDFERNPRPLPEIAEDLDVFITRFSHRPAFQLFAKPAIILSGSVEYSPTEIRTLGTGRRAQILLLGSEKTPGGIERLRGAIDGNAYYWSSVNPQTFGHYQQKLDDMSAATHADGGIWIAPAAAGFDARLVGGKTIVERLDGETLSTEVAAAEASDPDAVGVISWNEFSENSHIEPSVQHGTRELATLASLLGAAAPPEVIGQMDSSEPGARGTGTAQAASLSLLALLVLGATGTLVRRSRRSTHQEPAPSTDRTTPTGSEEP